MISYLYSLLTTKDPNVGWYRLLIILTLILSVFLITKKINTTPFYEGFEQKEKFLLKIDNKIYDDFYVEIYDQLQKTEERTSWEVQQLVNSIDFNKNSVILDIGCGTGHLVNKLQKLKYNVYGVDNSRAMISACENKFSDINVQLGDVSNPMLYDKNTFTHILCTNFTLYRSEEHTSELQSH